MPDSIAFKRGYLLACTTLVALHKEHAMAAEVLETCGLKEADIAAMKLGDLDLALLRQIRDQAACDPIRQS